MALSQLGFIGEVTLTLSAIAGSLLIMILIAYVSQKVRGNVSLLIMGVMIGYIATAIIGVLKFFSAEEDIRAYVIWGLGSFARVSGGQTTVFVVIMLVVLPFSFLLTKTLNLLLLGDSYARNLGLNIKRARLLVISCAGILVAIVTAYIAVPSSSSDWPCLTSAGGFSTPRTMPCCSPHPCAPEPRWRCLCNLIARMPGFEGALPVNSVTALGGCSRGHVGTVNKRKSER